MPPQSSDHQNPKPESYWISMRQSSEEREREREKQRERDRKARNYRKWKKEQELNRIHERQLKKRIEEYNKGRSHDRQHRSPSEKSDSQGTVYEAEIHNQYVVTPGTRQSTSRGVRQPKDFRPEEILEHIAKILPSTLTSKPRPGDQPSGRPILPSQRNVVPRSPPRNTHRGETYRPRVARSPRGDSQASASRQRRARTPLVDRHSHGRTHHHRHPSPCRRCGHVYRCTCRRSRSHTPTRSHSRDRYHHHRDPRYQSSSRPRSRESPSRRSRPSSHDRAIVISRDRQAPSRTPHKSDTRGRAEESTRQRPGTSGTQHISCHPSIERAGPLRPGPIVVSRPQRGNVNLEVMAGPPSSTRPYEGGPGFPPRITIHFKIGGHYIETNEGGPLHLWSRVLRANPGTAGVPPVDIPFLKHGFTLQPWQIGNRIELDDGSIWYPPRDPIPPFQNGPPRSYGGKKTNSSSDL